MASATRLFVGNLPENTNEDALRAAFSNYGEITNFEIKSKPLEEQSKKFAFISLCASNFVIESCIKHFSVQEFGGSRLYVTRARESFLERLQRERQSAQEKDKAKDEEKTIPKENPVLKFDAKLNPRKRKVEDHNQKQPYINGFHNENNKRDSYENNRKQVEPTVVDILPASNNRKKVEPTVVEILPASNNKLLSAADKKKFESDKKRLESIKKKRQDFKEKQKIIQSGLVGIDKVQNKKVVFSDSDNETTSHQESSSNSKADSRQQKSANSLFDDDDSDADVNFEIKEQFEGKKGQKVLELQSRYKSDKRFVLDERFVEDENSEGEEDSRRGDDQETIDVGQCDNKDKQLNILQDVLGITLKSSSAQKSDSAHDKKKAKIKLGMLRFDPSHPEHSKYLAPVEEKSQEPAKKNKKKKNKEKVEEVIPVQKREPVTQVEVSKEQFYKISDTLREAIVQPNTFSLRSLFSKDVDDKDEFIEESPVTHLEKKNQKVVHPLDPGERNPFKYDSSDSEDEEPEKAADSEIKAEPATEVKAVWKENLFFTTNDIRLADGLAFFNQKPNAEIQKDRRELKSVMKKRLYNKGRKDQMFKKKIGGRSKSQKKIFRKKT